MIKDRKKILLAIKEAGFNLIEIKGTKEYLLVADYYKITDNERIVK